MKSGALLPLVLVASGCGDTFPLDAREDATQHRGLPLQGCDPLAASCQFLTATLSAADTFRVISATLAGSDTDVTLGWEPPVDPAVTTVRIERSSSPSGPWSGLADLSPSDLLFTDTVPGTTAFYRLVELDGTVELDVSDPVRVLSVADVEYHLPEETVPGIDFDTSLFGVVRYPDDLLAGPFPLVVFLHGNHGNCRDLVTREDVCVTLESQLCDEPGFETAPNAHGHVYLQETLAAQGFVTVSLGANALNCRNDINGFVPQRIELILEHLRRWSTWNGAGAPPFGALFSGAVDMSRVALFGHSRGAEAVSATPQRLQDTPIAGVSLASSFAVAPTDFTNPDPSGVRSGGLIPSCDADVSDLAGVVHFDRALNAGNSNAHAQVFTIGANHNFFNTEWLEDDNQFPDIDPVCNPDQLLGAPAQQALLEPVLSDWVLQTTGNAVLPPYMRADAGTPEVIEEWAQTALDLRWSYAASTQFFLDRFRIQEEPDDLNEVGGVNTYTDFSEVLWFGNCSQSCRLRPRRQAPRTAWNGPANANIDLLNLDASGFETLSARFASSPQVGPLDPGVSEHDFTLLVRDIEGESAEVSLASVGRLAHGYPRANPALVHEVLSTVRVPLATFVAENPALDLSQLQAVEFVMPGNGSSTGGVWLADLELVSDEPAPDCTEAEAIDLGAPANAVTVANDACLRVLNGYPPWWGARNMQLQSMTPGDYPVPFTWSNTCAGGQGSGVFTGDWQPETFGPTSDACATLIDLGGSGTGSITLRYFDAP